MSALWSRFYGWILGALAIIASFAAIYLRGRSAGKAVERKKATQRDLSEAQHRAETIRETVNVEAEVNRLPDGDLDERLRQWTRD